MEIGRVVIVGAIILIPLFIIFITKNKEKKSEKQLSTSLNKDGKLQEYIIYVASQFENDTFFSRAKEVAEKLHFSEAKNLIDYFHKDIPCPDDLKESISKIGVFGVWLDIRQNAIFEILSNYKVEAVPLLYKIGFGVYDWTQYKAIGILLNFVKEGITDDKVLDDLIQKLHHLRYEAIINILTPLSQIQNNDKVDVIFKRVYDLFSDDFSDSLHILEVWSKLSPDNVLNYKVEIMGVLLNEQKFKELQYSPETKEELNIRGNILFFNLDKNDLSLKNNLDILSRTASNQKLRDYIFKTLEK